MDFKKALEEARSKSPKRKFVQSVDLTVNFKDVDFNKPDNRLNLEVPLPNGKGKKVRVAVIAGDALINEAKEKAERVIRAEEIEGLGQNKSELKKLADSYDYFLCQTDLMPSVGRHLGQVLAPRDKMPLPVPPTAKLEPFLKRLEKVVRIKTKGKFTPTVHTTIGTEEMSDEQLVENANKIIDSLKEKLPNREGNIRSIFLKLTMGPAVKVT